MYALKKRNFDMEVLVLGGILLSAVQTVCGARSCYSCVAKTQSECRRHQTDGLCTSGEDSCIVQEYTIQHGDGVTSNKTIKGCVNGALGCQFYCQLLLQNNLAMKSCQISCCQDNLCNKGDSTNFTSRAKHLLSSRIFYFIAGCFVFLFVFATT